MNSNSAVGRCSICKQTAPAKGNVCRKCTEKIAIGSAQLSLKQVRETIESAEITGKSEAVLNFRLAATYLKLGQRELQGLEAEDGTE